VSSDFLALGAAVLLLLGNAFFVGAEFALISSRRDRLETMARAGTPGASAVLKAGADLSRMLAAAQLGITICSLLLGRLGEPAVAHLIERPFNWLGLPDEVLGPVAFTISLVVVVVAHMVLGEMVPKNIAIAGPERTAIWLVPPFLAFTTVMGPVISLFKITAAGVLRLMGVQPRDELDTAITSDQLADLIAESGREGLLDDHGSRRLTRTLSSAGHTVADVLVTPVELVSLPQRPVVDDVARAWRHRLLPLPGARRRRASPATCTSRTSWTSPTTPGAEVPSQRIPAAAAGAGHRPARRRARRAARAGAHLGRAVDAGGATAGSSPSRDLIEHYVGTVSDATHAREEPSLTPGVPSAGWRRCRSSSGGPSAAAHRERVRRFTGAAPRGASGAATRTPVLDFLFTYYSHRPARLEEWHPGPGVVLLGGAEYLGRPGYVADAGGGAPRPEHAPPARADRPVRAHPAHRHRGPPARLSCFGLHEWAMVYRSPTPRHAAVPLRLGAAGTDAVSRRLPCTAPTTTRSGSSPRPPGRATPSRPRGPTRWSTNSPAACTPPWISTSGPTSSPPPPRPTWWRSASSSRRTFASWTCGPAPTTSPPRLPAGAHRDRRRPCRLRRAQAAFARRAAPLRERLVDVCSALL
jgi:hypothetical protein